MGILSGRNFIAPFTNQVNIIAVAFIVLLFLVFRFSLGKYQLSSVSDSPRQKAASSTTSSENRQNANVSPSAKADSPKNTVDIMKEIEGLKSEPGRTGAVSQKPSQEREGGKGGLDEIEKAMGLR